MLELAEKDIWSVVKNFSDVQKLSEATEDTV